jgi:hypothetical protein
MGQPDVPRLALSSVTQQPLYRRLLVIIATAAAMLAITSPPSYAYSVNYAFDPPCGVIAPFQVCYSVTHGFNEWARVDAVYQGAGNQTLCSGAETGSQAGDPYFENCSGNPGEPSYNSSFACYYSNCSDQVVYFMTAFVFQEGPNNHTIIGAAYAN